VKKFCTIVLLSVFLLVFCGTQPQEKKAETKIKGEDMSYGVLNEPEVQKLIKALPVFKIEMAKKSEEWENIKPDENIGNWLQGFAKTEKDIAELDAKLKSAGMSWSEFYPAFGKTIMAISAVMYDSTMVKMKKEMKTKEGEVAQLEAKLKDPKVSAQEKEMIKASLEMMKSMQQSIAGCESLYVKVPRANRDLVKKYWKELTEVLEIED